MKTFYLMKVFCYLGLISAFVCLVSCSAYENSQLLQRQAHLNGFYQSPPAFASKKPGDLLRLEPLQAAIPLGGQGYRILYRSETEQGTPTVASGMVFIPPGAPPKTGWNVVAWAHPTTGMGVACAPSRFENPLRLMSWLEDMLSKGWIVVATDYSGLGTEGIQHYLVGPDEARDILNSVRAVQHLSNIPLSQQFALWGHSQGAHAVLFAADLASHYLPEWHLVGVASASPPTELMPLFKAQYQTMVSWVLAPSVTVSWSTVYPHLDFKRGLSKQALSNYQRLAHECVFKVVGESEWRTVLHQYFFKTNPRYLPAWRWAAIQQSAPVLDKNIPVLIVQGLKDNIVLPGATAQYVQTACRQGSNIQVLWYPQGDHIRMAQVAGPVVSDWLQKQFLGQPNQRNCQQPLPIQPLRNSKDSG